MILKLLLPSLVLTGSSPSVKPETVIGADLSNGVYAYKLSDRFYESPNTIEAWVRLGKKSKYEDGGVIFGNYYKYNEGSVNLEINKSQNVVLKWNSNEIEVVFDQYVLPTDRWVHISVVREKSSAAFKLYINGILKQTINRSVGAEPVSAYKYLIGTDCSHWGDSKNYFRGEISQVTVYRSELNSHEIYKDYVEGDEINYHNRDNLLFNGILNLNDTKIIDTSRHANHAYLVSSDYYYEGDLYDAVDYSFSVIPDPQMISNHRRDQMHHLGDYLLKQYESQKIALAMCVGDNADATGNWDLEFGSISGQLYRLDGKIRHTTVPGNHDYDNNCTQSRSLEWYNKYYSQEKISSYDYYGGVFKEGHTENSYYLFNESGVNYLIMCLEFGAEDDVLSWANDIVSAYPNHRVIVTTHAYLDADGEKLTAPKAHAPSLYAWNKYVKANDGDDFYDKFIKNHENIFMVFCGHIPVDDIIVREDVGIHGNVITSFLIDAQGLLRNDACDLMLGMFAFDELNQQVKINYVSAITNQLYNIQNQFVYSFKGHTKILSTKYYKENGEMKAAYQLKAESYNNKLPSALIPITLGGITYFVVKGASKQRKEKKNEK